MSKERNSTWTIVTDNTEGGNANSVMNSLSYVKEYALGPTFVKQAE